jgi:hypothetical protein
MKAYFAFLLTTVLCVIISPVAAQMGSKNISIQFQHKVGNADLQLFDSTYRNAFGEPFTVNRFRYYISHVALRDDNENIIDIKNDYHLIDEEDSMSKKILLHTSLKKITTLEFTIGVDSIKNISGVQTGDLDPSHGMFWTWNSGYIFAKLEGQSDSAHSPNHAFTYDIGGFKQKENALRKVVLVVPSNNDSNEIIINVDILKWFQAKYDFKLSHTPYCHQPGKMAQQLADNYATMFSISSKR